MANFPTNIPIDGDQLTKVFHLRGINMRYLGRVASLMHQTEATSLMYMKELCEQEMVARSCKRVLRELLAPISLSLMSACVSHFFNCLFAGKDQDVKCVIPEFATMVCFIRLVFN